MNGKKTVVPMKPTGGRIMRSFSFMKDDDYSEQYDNVNYSSEMSSEELNQLVGNNREED